MTRTILNWLATFLIMVPCMGFGYWYALNPEAHIYQKLLIALSVGTISGFGLALKREVD